MRLLQTAWHRWLPVLLAVALVLASDIGLMQRTPPGTHCPTQAFVGQVPPRPGDADFVPCACAETRAAKAKDDRDHGAAPPTVAILPRMVLEVDLPARPTEPLPGGPSIGKLVPPASPPPIPPPRRRVT